MLGIRIRGKLNLWKHLDQVGLHSSASFVGAITQEAVRIDLIVGAVQPQFDFVLIGHGAGVLRHKGDLGRGPSEVQRTQCGQTRDGCSPQRLGNDIGYCWGLPKTKLTQFY